MGYGQDGRHLIPDRGKKCFSSQRPIQPPIELLPRPLSPGVKRPGRESDRSPPNAEVKNGGAIPPLPTRLHGVLLN
jgi:hypothetical protein